MYKSLLAVLILAISGSAIAGEASAPLPGMPQWISIQYGEDSYASQFGDYPFSAQAPMQFETAKEVPVDALADRGAQLIKIRQAFEDGMREGLRIKEGDNSCQANSGTLANYWVIFKDGTFIRSNAIDVVTLKHVPASWAPLFPVADTKVYDPQDVRIAGLLLAAMYRQPCADAQHFMALGEGRLYTVVHQLMPSIGPPPPPPPMPPSPAG
jgi:hypothetical protein